jgi:hypothetical protein
MNFKCCCLFINVLQNLKYLNLDRFLFKLLNTTIFNIENLISNEFCKKLLNNWKLKALYTKFDVKS